MFIAQLLLLLLLLLPDIEIVPRPNFGTLCPGYGIRSQVTYLTEFLEALTCINTDLEGLGRDSSFLDLSRKYKIVASYGIPIGQKEVQRGLPGVHGV